MELASCLFLLQRYGASSVQRRLTTLNVVRRSTTPDNRWKCDCWQNIDRPRMLKNKNKTCLLVPTFRRKHFLVVGFDIVTQGHCNTGLVEGTGFDSCYLQLSYVLLSIKNCMVSARPEKDINQIGKIS